MSAIIIVNNDPSISYQGAWTTVQAQGTVVHATACTQGQTSFSFTFTGTRVAVFGALVPSSSNSSLNVASTYSIDNSKPITYRPPANTTVENDNVEFFESSDLSDGQHTLFANVTSCSSDNLYVMTSLAYIPSSKASVSSASLTTSLSLPTSSTTAGGATSQSHSSTPIGAIVGGVIGGVALLIISAIAIWFFCFRQRHGQPYFYKSAEAGDLLSQEVKPYEVPGPQSPPSTATSPPSQGGPMSYYAPTFASTSSPPASDAGGSSAYGGGNTTNYTRQSHAPSTVLSVANAAPPVRASPNQPQSKAAEAGLLSIPQEATYHADSGVRFGPSGEPSGSGSGAVPADVPPMYTPN